MLNVIVPELAAALTGCAIGITDLPEVRPTSDNTRITGSCRIVIEPGRVIADTDGDGVLHIEADDITVEFAPGSVLRGAEMPSSTRPEPSMLSGCGIRIAGRRGVTIKDAAVRGYKTAIYATRADGLTIESAQIRDQFRQRLYSLPSAEDSRDWLWPHANDQNEWLKNYGAAVYVEDSRAVTLRDITVRSGQNGIVLDRVDDSAIYDNDCSFLSGWGLAMWRSSGNTVSRNAFDFCVRGHSEGVYNRGQDSAGILMFEQCSRNIIAENSATHCGDGLFGFAGKEAIGEVAPAPGTTVDYARAGCNDNIIMGNDFSYASAHGLEMTFSHGNQILRNRFVQDSICGIWGGYSQETLIAENTFEGNGGMPYGRERGGVNIEHGWGNRIVANTFTNNAAGVRLWWDDDKKLLELPGVKTPYKGVANNDIQSNKFVYSDTYAMTIAGSERRPLPAPAVLEISDAGKGNVRGNTFLGNDVVIDLPEGSVKSIDATPGAEPLTTAQAGDDPSEGYIVPAVKILGKKTPVGARTDYAGRARIHIGPWGPWDQKTPMVRLASRGAMGVVYEMFGGENWNLVSSARELDSDNLPGIWPNSRRYVIRAQAGVWPYELTFRATADDGPFEATFAGTIVSAEWSVRFFASPVDPRPDEMAWRAGAFARGVVEVPSPAIDFDLAGESPAALFPPDLIEQNPGVANLPKDNFGMIATARFALPPGNWRFVARSDDGVRLRIGDRLVIDNWTHHAETRDEGVYTASDQGPLHPDGVLVELSYFELDGAAKIRLDVEKAD